jgi:hypothetical protein
MNQIQTDQPRFPKIYREFDETDIDNVARLCALRLTETDACAHLGIKFDSWRAFKCRGKNKARFINALARLKSAKVEAMVADIEAARDKLGQPDWRARAWLLERVFSHDTIGRKESEVQQTVSGQVTHKIEIDGALKKIFGDEEPAIDVTAEPLAIAERSGEN